MELLIYPLVAAVIVAWLTVLRLIDRRAQRRHDEYMRQFLARWAGQNQQEGER